MENRFSYIFWILKAQSIIWYIVINSQSLIVFQISKCINVIGTPKFMDFQVKVERGSDGTSYLGYNADHKKEGTLYYNMCITV